MRSSYGPRRLAKEKGRLAKSVGSWKMSDEEAEEMFAGLRRHWRGSTSRIRRKDYGRITGLSLEEW